MKKRKLPILATLFYAVLFSAAIAKADVPFPTAVQADVPADSAQDVQSTAVNTSTLPMDPTFFAALIGSGGLLLGCLITLSGAFVMARLNKRPPLSPPSDGQIKELPTQNKLIA